MVYTNKLKSSYELPIYRIDAEVTATDNTLPVNFLRLEQEGIIHEDLLEMMITDLSAKNKEVPNPYTLQVIARLYDCQALLLARKNDRVLREVINTREQ